MKLLTVKSAEGRSGRWSSRSAERWPSSIVEPPSETNESLGSAAAPTTASAAR